jgi:hypothetical protein
MASIFDWGTTGAPKSITDPKTGKTYYPSTTPAPTPAPTGGSFIFGSAPAPKSITDTKTGKTYYPATDEMTTPTMPTPEQAKVLGVTVTSTPVTTHAPSIPQSKLETAKSTGVLGTGLFAENIDTIESVSKLSWQEAIPMLAKNLGDNLLYWVKNASADWLQEELRYNKPENYQDYWKSKYEQFDKLSDRDKILFYGTLVNQVQLENGRYKPIIVAAVDPGEASLAYALPRELQALRQLRVAGAAELGMRDAEYTRFINARLADDTLSPENFKAGQQAISRWLEPFETKPTGYINPEQNAGLAEIQDAWNAAQRAKWDKVWNVIENNKNPRLEGSDFDELNMTKGQYDNMVQFLKSQQATTNIVSIKPSTSQIQTLVQSTEIAPEAKIVDLINKGALSLSLATNTQATLNVINTVAPGLRDIALSNVSTKVADAIRNNERVSTIQSIASAEVKEQTKLDDAMQTLTKTAAKVIADNETKPASEPAFKPLFKDETVSKPDIKSQVKAELNTKVKAITDPALRAKVQPYVETITETATRTQVKAATKTATKTATETGVARVTRVSEDETMRGKTKTPFKPIGGDSDEINITHEGKQIKLTKADAWIAWKQGIFYILKWKPYDKAHTIYSKKPIAGVPYASGVGSAAKSIVARNGEIPKELRFDMGIEDVTIDRVYGTTNVPEIHYRLDRSVSGRRHRTTRGSSRSTRSNSGSSIISFK